MTIFEFKNTVGPVSPGGFFWLLESGTVAQLHHDSKVIYYFSQHLPSVRFVQRHGPGAGWPPRPQEWSPWNRAGTRQSRLPFSLCLGWARNSHPDTSDQPLTREMVFPSSLHVCVGCHLIRGRFHIFILSFPGGTALPVSPQRAGLCLQDLFMCTAWYICVQCWAQGGLLDDDSGAIWASVNTQHEQSSCSLPDVCKVSSHLLSQTLG